MESQRQQTFVKIEATNLESSTQQTSARYLYRTQNNSQVSFMCIEKMFRDQQLCDIVLETEGRELRAHKLILAASSAIFYNMFVQNANLDLSKRISIEHIDFETLCAVVDFFYTSEVSIGEDNVERLLAAAYNLAAKDLQKACWDFLRGNLNVGNCLDTVQMARRYQSNSLSSVAHDYLVENFSEFTESGKHLQMDFDDFRDSIKSTASCSAQDLLLEHVIRWVRSDFEHRRRYFVSLIDHIDFCSVTHECFLLKIDEERWLPNEPEFMVKYVKSLRLDRPIVLASKRAESSKLLVVVGTRGIELSVEAYSFVDKVWLKGPESVNLEHYWEAVAIHGKTIYCLDNGKLISAVINFNAPQMTLVDCGANLKPRMGYDVCAVGNSIYVAGYEHNGLLSTAAAFDVSAGRWKRIASMSEGRSQLSLGTLNGLLYAVGGWTTSSRYANSMERYDPGTDSWQAMPPMAVGRRYPGVGAFRNQLIVVGGYNTDRYSKHVEAFDPVSRTWRLLPDMIVARAGPGVIAFEDKLFVIGGYYNGFLSSVEIYNAESNTWSLMPTSMHTGKEFVSVALIDKSILYP